MPLQTRDTALQNEVVRLYCQFMRSGALTNPAAQPLVEIIGADGATIIDSLPAQMEYDGIWYVDWFVPQNLPLGTYYDKWTFQWDSTASVEELTMPIQVRSFDNYLNFISRGLSHKVSSRVVQLSKDLENFFIYEATHIPIYWEQGMRIQQEDQQKRTKTFYYFELDADETYAASEGDVYFSNGNKYNVFINLDVRQFYSSSSSFSTSSESSELESESSSSLDSSSSTSSSSTSLSSESSLDMSTSSSSSESEANESTTSSLTEEPTPKITLTCVGTGAPLASGTLTKVSGSGSQSIKYVGFSSKRSKFSTIYNFAYRNWVRDHKPIVRINQRIVDDGWYADYDGNIYLDRLMSPRDTIECCYKFSCFSFEHLLGFLRMGLMMMNSLPPASTTYSALDNMPYEWNAPVLLYAAIQSLRRTLYGMNFQEKRAIYGGAGFDTDGWAQQAVSVFQSLYTDYNTQWAEVSANAKTKKLTGISLYVTPEYSLPGGRCISGDTNIKCVIDGEFYEKTIADIFDDFENKKEIMVQSVFSSSERLGMFYEKASMIWKSGEKETFLLKTQSKSIRLTKEHLVYLPRKNIFAPLQDINEEDYLLVTSDNGLVEEKIIEKPIYFGKEETYDIEVQSTENFIGNGIVSHNSRYFRYSYKTNA